MIYGSSLYCPSPRLMRRFAVLVILLIGFGASSQQGWADAIVLDLVVPDFAAPDLAAPDSGLTIACDDTVRPQRRRDAGIQYRPGWDVHGRPVAAADLPASSIFHPILSKLRVELDLLEGRGAGVPGLESNLEMGPISGLRASRLGGLDQDSASALALLPCPPR